MTPELLTILIQSAASIIQFIMQAKANGSISDADLEAAITSTNTDTQAAIRAALAGSGGLGLIPPA